MSLFVVYLPVTGHVVGAVNAIGATLPADPEAPADPVPLVGTALPVRVAVGPGEIATFSLLARDLAIHAADDEPRVFIDPLAYGVEQVGIQPPKPALVRLTSDPGVELAFSLDGLIVTVPTELDKPATVLALVSDGPDTIVRRADIGAGEDSVELPMTVASGETRGVLVLVAGWAGVLKAVTRQ